MIGPVPELRGRLAASFLTEDGSRRVGVWVDPLGAWAVQVLQREPRGVRWRTVRSASERVVDAVWVHQSVHRREGGSTHLEAAEAEVGRTLPWRLRATQEWELRWSRGTCLERVRVEEWTGNSGIRQSLQQEVCLESKPCDECNSGQRFSFAPVDLPLLVDRAPRKVKGPEVGWPAHVQVRSAFLVRGMETVPGRRPLRVELLQRAGSASDWRVRVSELECVEWGRREVRVWCGWPEDPFLERDLMATTESEAWREAWVRVEGRGFVRDRVQP